MKIIKTLAYTNPFAYVLGLPVALGIVLAAATFGIYENTVKIVKN